MFIVSARGKNAKTGYTEAYARGRHWGLVPQWLHDTLQITISVSGEAIVSAENSGKPLGGRGSDPNPAGGAYT